MRWIDQDDALTEVANQLSASKYFYLDTEFESTKRHTRLSVIQVSAGQDLFLLDALRLTRLRTLAPTLLAPDATWVLHAGTQDVELLLDALGGRQAPTLFDTQVAWAMLGAEASVSLSYLKFRMLGLRSMKTHQADDWMRRPLPPAQLKYAAEDIEHLPRLFEELQARLVAKHRAWAVAEACNELLQPKADPPAELSLDSFRNAWQLEPKNQAALKFIIGWYNGLSERDRAAAPPAKTLLALASRLPRSRDDLMRVKGVPMSLKRSAGDLVKGMREAADQADAGDFVEIAPPPYATFEEIRLEAWLQCLRAEVCSELELAPELVLPSRLLKRFGAHEPGALETWLGGWRTRLMKEAILGFMKRSPMPS